MITIHFGPSGSDSGEELTITQNLGDESDSGSYDGVSRIGEGRAVPCSNQASPADMTSTRSLEHDFGNKLYLGDGGASQRAAGTQGSAPGGHLEHQQQRRGPQPFRNAPPLPSHAREAPTPNVLLRLRLKAGGGAVVSLPESSTTGLPTFKPVVYPNPGVDDDDDDDDDEGEGGGDQGRYGGGQRTSQTAGYYGGTGNDENRPVRLHQIPVQHISTVSSTRYTGGGGGGGTGGGAVMSGIASSVPMAQMAVPVGGGSGGGSSYGGSGIYANSDAYRAAVSSAPVSASAAASSSSSVVESDYVNAPAMAALQRSDEGYYSPGGQHGGESYVGRAAADGGAGVGGGGDDEEEGGEDYIPPAVPSKLSYGSVAASPHTPQIKGPQYRIAADVYTGSGGGGGLPPPAPPPPPPPASAGGGMMPPRGIRGHYPEPVASRLMYTTPVAPAGQGFVESRPKGGTSLAAAPTAAATTTSGGRPPPAYDHPAHRGPASFRPQTTEGSPSRSYVPPLQQTVPPTGLYNYSAEHQAPPGSNRKEAEVDALTQMLMQNMEAAADPDFFGPCSSCGRQVRGIYNACVALDAVFHIHCFRCRSCGMCARCGRSIMGETSGCSALDQLYHIDCFSCIACGQCLGGQPFFAMEGKPYCEGCYMNTLEKCSVCSKAITDRILRATGKPYHPGCFTCVVCGKSLDGVPFTVDATNQIHCIEDFHKKFAPRCCVCGEPIMPDAGQEETIRIVAMDKSFHVECYKCEDCGMVLSSEAEGRGCYPLDDHILCKNCNAHRIQAMTTKMTTEL